MTDYRHENILNLIVSINDLANKLHENTKTRLYLEKESEEKIKELQEILRYNGIEGSYMRVKEGKCDK